MRRMFSSSKLVVFVFTIISIILYHSFFGRPIVDDSHRIKTLETKVEKLKNDLAAQQKDLLYAPFFPPVKTLPLNEKKRILITGGAGFIGSHLVDYLLREGHEIIVVDNFFTGRRHNVEHWLGHKHFELIHHDVVNPLFLEVDEVYHLASPASPPNYMYNPIKTLKTNLLGTLNMLGLARRTKARFLLASTSEVYGDPDVHPQPESYWGHVNPIGPRACYDEGKRAAEALTHSYAVQDGVDARIARIFNTYGPRMQLNDGRVVSNFIVQALQNHTITIHGSGTQTRSFQYVDDLVTGLVRLMHSNYTLPVNLGNPSEHSMIDFARIVHRLTSSHSSITHVTSAQDDPRRRKPDISVAKRVLQWEPMVGLDDGLNRTIRYFRAQLTQSVSNKLT